MRKNIMDEVKRTFRPEFLNRVDEVIVFHGLTSQQIEEIVDILLKRLTGAIETQGMKVEVSAEAKELLAKEGFDPQYGARPMRRAVERYLEDPLAEEILRGNVKPGTKVNVTAKDGKLLFQSDLAQKEAAGDKR